MDVRTAQLRISRRLCWLSAARAAIAGSPGDWRLVAVDVDGFDLALEQRVVRIPFAAPVKDSEDVRRELGRLVQEL